MQPKSRHLMICYITALIGGFCVMAVEIVAGRLIARYLGVSLYTWTSVIGVVLAGISLGSYLGGRIADKFPPEKALSVLFILASIGCVLVPPLNNLMGKSVIGLYLSWPVRITLHVAIIFFLPSCILGMISPVVAKFALDQGLKTGQTIGNIYAFSAAGSILGTFVTGFFLIAHIGTVAIVWTIAGALGLVSLFYGRKRVFPYIGIGVVVFLSFISFSPLSWAQTMAVNLFLVGMDQENLVYAKDSQYSYVSVVKDKNDPSIYSFKLDSLIQTQMKIDQPTNLGYAYGYYSTFADIVKYFNTNEEKLSVLNLGGGGYLFPRYLEKIYPESYIDVVEIDSGITQAAMSLLGFSTDSSIQIHHLDARNFVEDLVRRKMRGEDIAYNFIFCDVFSGGLAVPYHLTTLEFNEKISSLISPEGLYVMNLVDSNTSPRFLKTMVNTLRESFNYIHVILPLRKRASLEKVQYRTYVIIASQIKLDKSRFESREFRGHFLSETAPELLKDDLKDIVLTDNFAPVDNLLKEVFSMQGKYRAYAQMIDRGVEFVKEERLEEALTQFEKALQISPNLPGAYSNIGSLMAWQGRHYPAIEYYQKTLEIEPRFIPAMLGLGNALAALDKIDLAIEVYYRLIEVEPGYVNAYVSLGDLLNKQGDIGRAIENYQKALDIDPTLEAAQNNLNKVVMKLLSEQAK